MGVSIPSTGYQLLNVASFINMEEVVCKQQQAAYIAESALKNLQADPDKKLNAYDTYTQRYNEVKESFDQL